MSLLKNLLCEKKLEECGGPEGLGSVGGKECNNIQHNSLTATSFTSSFNSRTHGLQQKFKRKKKVQNNELTQVQEEYDIQTVISGLTRNSEFFERRDPPASASDDKDSNRDDAANHSSEWPDDESCGLGHNVIRVVDRGQVQSENAIRYHRDDRVSRHAKQSTKAIMVEPNGTRLESSTRKEHHSNDSAQVDYIDHGEANPGVEVMLSPEPDGVKFRSGRSNLTVEPSGTKIETVIYTHTPKENSKKSNRMSSWRSDTRRPGARRSDTRRSNSRRSNRRRSDPKRSEARRPDTILMDIQTVEVVYKDNGSTINKGNGKRRSKSTIGARQNGENRHSWRNTIEKRSDFTSSDGSYTSIGRKIRSRSLPRTLKQITSRYRKDGERESKNSDSASRDNHLNPFINDVVRAVNNEIVSSLGSHCEGIESPHLIQHKKVEELKTSKDSHNTVSPSCRTICDMSEPRVCVEFSKRKSGGYFQTTCYSSENTSDFLDDRKNYRNVNKTSRMNPETESESEDVASNMMFTRQETIALHQPPVKFSKKSKKGKVQVNAIAAEASRNLLLSPTGVDEFFKENEDFFHRTKPSQFEQRSVPITPSPDREAERQGSSVRSHALSMTPAGRKELIQRYLTLRDRQSQLESSVLSHEQHRSSLSQSNKVRFSGDQSVRLLGRDDRNTKMQVSSSKKRDKVMKRKGYDDGSKHYHRAKLALSPSFTDDANYDDGSKHYNHAEPSQFPFFNHDVKENNVNGSSIGRSRARSEERLRKALMPQRGSTTRRDTGGRDKHRENTGIPSSTLVNSNYHHAMKQETWVSPPLISYPASQQEKISYSYISDDDSMAVPSVTPKFMFDAHKSDATKSNAFSAPSSYEDELRHHNQFMKTQMGFGNQ